MIADILLVIIAIIALIFATIIDIKTKEVPNWITYSLIISALAIRLITSLAINHFYYIINALIALVIIYLIAQLLYHLQIWGGGDSKLLIGLTTTFSTQPYFFKSSYPFLLILFISILTFGVIYASIIAISIAVKNRNKFKQEFKKIINHKKIRLIRILSFILSIIILILIIISKQTTIRLLLLISLILIFSYIYLWIAVKSIENISMYKQIPISKLVEGDWVIHNIKKDERTIYKKRFIGITKQEIENLKKHNIKQVIIKTGIPFVPPFLLGLIATIIIGFI